MVRFLLSTFTRTQLQAASGAPVGLGRACAHLGLAVRFCAAAVLGLTVVVGVIVV